jgi:small ligand-binding sensory domain FIST
MNRFGAGCSTDQDLDVAVSQACDEALRGCGERPTLALLFVSHEHHEGFARVARLVRARTGAFALIGCGGDSLVGNGREVEDGPCVVVWLAHFPEGEVEAFALDVEQDDESIHVRGFPGVGTPPERGGPLSLLLLGEPYTFPADLFLQQLESMMPGVPVLGGMASGGRGPGSNVLFHDDECRREGAVGVVLRGVRMRHVVSQGCRPVGRTFVITKAHSNVVEELAGKAPLHQLKSLFEEAADDEKQVIERALRGGGLHVGTVVDERISQPARGDFLVRNVVGIDPKSGVMQIGDHARRGRSLRFHVRDAPSADEDLKTLLEGAGRERPAAAALLFTCNGRGSRLFGATGHDTGCVQRALGPLPTAGFFAAGEIGPVGGRNFLHGFTASVGLFDAE